MAIDTEEPTAPPEPGAEEPAGRSPARDAVTIGLFALALVVGAVITWVVLAQALDYMRDRDSNRLLVIGLALALGVGGIFFLFWAMDRLVNMLPRDVSERVRPYVYVGPALVILAVFLIYPVINTIILSFKDNIGQDFVGLDNFKFVFTDPSMLRSIRNTLLWIVLVPLCAVSIGLIFATLADRLRRGEAIAKSLIFLPMAISFVGAAVTWRLVYGFRPEGFGSNVGLLNGIKLGLGQDPVAWLTIRPWNNLLLIVIMIWIQTGFAMVVLSAAIKSIPDEIVEAARIDGASELQVFRHITVPSVLPTIVVVTTYMVINAMKVFDIVYVMGSPEANQTEVIAERMIQWFFLSNNDGRGAAIAVVLFLAVIPVMVWNVRQFRQQEAIR
ncbi:MAG TPA: sugar ABC transporter permease [Acidimicrobiales bacterium]|nr:sugar ABC transporter permease [Acidimicrobiales bacterium]